MTSPDESPTLGELQKHCKICASSLPATAIKCVKCGSYQDFRRYLDFSNSTIALLIALISVIGLAQKNLSELYRSIFIDPLKSDISIHIQSIQKEKISILFQNNGASRVTLNDGTLCRIPILKPGLEPDGHLFTRYPKPTEITALHMIVYQDPHEQHVVEGGRSASVTYLLHQTRPEDGRPFEDNAAEIRAYCFVSYIDQRGEKDGRFIQIQAFDAYRLQLELKS